MLESGRYVSPYVPAIGTIRRIRALAFNGWGQIELGKRLGVPQARISKWARGECGEVETAHAAAVARLFRELWDKPGPSRRARLAALRHGYEPALAWDNIDDPREIPNRSGEAKLGRYEDWDEVVVDLAMSGQRPKLRPAEMNECVARLHERKWSDNRIGQYLGVTGDGVRMARVRLNLEAWPNDDQVIYWRADYPW